MEWFGKLAAAAAGGGVVVVVAVVVVVVGVGGGGLNSDEAKTRSKRTKEQVLGESPKLSQVAVCCLISVCHAEEVTQPLE